MTTTTTSWSQTTIKLSPHSKGAYLVTKDIERQLGPQLQEYKIGLVHLFVQHTSCALSLNENWDEDVRADMSDALDRIVPEDDKLYRHDAEGRDDMPVRTVYKTPLFYPFMVFMVYILSVSRPILFIHIFLPRLSSLSIFFLKINNTHTSNKRIPVIINPFMQGEKRHISKPLSSVRLLLSLSPTACSTWVHGKGFGTSNFAPTYIPELWSPPFRGRRRSKG